MIERKMKSKEDLMLWLQDNGYTKIQTGSYLGENITFPVELLPYCGKWVDVRKHPDGSDKKWYDYYDYALVEFRDSEDCPEEECNIFIIEDWLVPIENVIKEEISDPVIKYYIVHKENCFTEVCCAGEPLISMIYSDEELIEFLNEKIECHGITSVEELWYRFSVCDNKGIVVSIDSIVKMKHMVVAV